MARLLPLLLLLLPCLPGLPLPAHDVDPLLNDAGAAPPARVPIALLHMYDSISFFQRLGSLTGANKARYARRHGYDFVQSVPGRTTGVLKPAPCTDSHAPDSKGRCWVNDDTFDIDHSRAPTFGKIKLALAACRGRDDGWLLWTDADALVVNQTVPLEAIIDDAYDIMLAYDWLMLNAGMLLLKCSDWTKDFFTQVYDARKFDTARALDQSSLQSHLDNLTSSERDAHVKVVPKYAMNVYTEEYRPGDFMLHMAGKLYEATEPGIVAIATQFDVLSMVDDIEDIKAFFRSKRLLNYYSATCKIDPKQRQHDCKPNDPRRILLNETLGSMSYPNRYRHVGLRYYWLGDWKDKYDVPGWNVKKRALPMPESAPPGQEMPPVPLASHHDKLNSESAHRLDGSVNGNERANLHSKPVHDDGTVAHDDRKPGQDPPEIEHDADVQPGGNAKNAKGEEKADSDDDDDDDDDDSWPWWLKLLLIGVCSSAVGGVVYGLRKRRQKFAKIQ